MNSQDQQIVNKLTNNTDLQKLGAHGGTTYLAAGAATGLNATTISIRANTSITVCTGVTSTGAAFNFLTGTNSFNISGVALIAGDLLIAPSGYRINAITTDAGLFIYS